MRNRILMSISALTFISIAVFSTSFAFAQGKTHSHTQMTLRLEARLTQEVRDGKITDVQKQLILPRLQALRADKAQLKGMTKAQRKAFLQAERKNLLDWAKQNGINPAYILGGHVKGGHTYKK